MKIFAFKKTLFTIVVVISPVMLIIFAEGVIRLTGIERERQQLFVTVPGHETHVVVNPRFAGRYFAGFQPETTPQPFLRDKPTDTRRYFVLGGSSAAGFPYDFSYGFPAYLQDMLQGAHPGTRIEVINLAMTAVNSFTLRDIHRYLIRYEPDGILIYAGHNEYYGAYGAGVVPGWMRPLAVRRFVLRLQNLHLVSLISRGGAGQSTEAAADRTLMARMAGDRLVFREDARFDEGIRHFERNMRDIVSTFRRNDIPVYLATVVSNKAGQQPLIADDRADRLFQKAGEFLQQEQPDSAHRYFRLAKEQDPLRFRSPSEINDVIREMANDETVYLIDTHRLETESGLPLPYDTTHFGDHLHPDNRGYFLLADAFRRTIEREGSEEDENQWEINTRIWRSEPNPMEQALVSYTLGVLKSDFPFVRDPDERTSAAYRDNVMQQYRTSDDPGETAAYAYLSGSRTLTGSLAELANHVSSAGSHKEALQTLRTLHYRQPLNPDLDSRILSYALDQAEGHPREVIPILVRFGNERFDTRIWSAATESFIRESHFGLAEAWLDAWESEGRYAADAEFYRLRARWHFDRGENEAAQPWFREYFRQSRNN